MNKAILIVIDGLGDLPTPKTALQAAKTPNMDRLAKSGATGLISPIGRGVVPGSDTSHLRLLGYEPKICYPGRGVLEALGAGFDLEDGDIAFRTNFATIKEGKIIDRRSGRIDTETAKSLSRLVPMRIEDVDVVFRSTVEHRGALILRGPGLSHCISETDPHAKTDLPQCIAMDESAEARKTARIINRFTQAVAERLANAPENKQREQNGKLPANIILLRGAGEYSRVTPFDERFEIHGACIAGGALYKGVAKFIGMDIFLVPGATGDKNTDLNAKAEAAVGSLETHDFVFLHVKACDSFGHDGDLKGKAKMLERIDKELLPKLIKSKAALIITGDHSTPCIRKAHSGHEVPILIHEKDGRPDKVKRFDELSCQGGGIGHITGKHLMPMILNIMGVAKKYGS